MHINAIAVQYDTIQLHTFLIITLLKRIRIFNMSKIYRVKYMSNYI